MIFEVDRREFLKAIKPAFEVSKPNVKKEFKYENLLTISAKESNIELLSYNGSYSLIAEINDSIFGSLNYNCKKEGKVTVYANDLIAFVQSLPDTYFMIKVFKESNQLKISATVDKIDGKEKKSLSIRSMSIIENEVKVPSMGKVFDKEIEIDREIFVKGMNSVLFAPAFEEKMYSYMCVLFEYIKNKEIRFSAGSGGRFAIKEIKGENIVSKGEGTSIIFPKPCLSSLVKLLSESNSAFITLKSSEADEKNNIPEQIIVDFDGMKLCIFGMEYLTKYPDLTKVIKHKYSNRIYSNLEEWNSVIRTIDGTKHRYNENIHNTEIVIEQDDEVIKVTPRTLNFSPTFIDMIDIDNCIIKGNDLWFRCNSDYIREMVVQGGKKGKIQINFESQADLNDSQEDNKKQRKPVLVKFEENLDSAKNTVDNFYMFFSTSTK
jgi:hypothetical protein